MPLDATSTPLLGWVAGEERLPWDLRLSACAQRLGVTLERRSLRVERPCLVGPLETTGVEAGGPSASQLVTWVRWPLPAALAEPGPFAGLVAALQPRLGRGVGADHEPLGGRPSSNVVRTHTWKLPPFTLSISGLGGVRTEGWGPSGASFWLHPDDVWLGAQLLPAWSTAIPRTPGTTRSLPLPGLRAPMQQSPASQALRAPWLHPTPDWLQCPPEVLVRWESEGRWGLAAHQLAWMAPTGEVRLRHVRLTRARGPGGGVLEDAEGHTLFSAGPGEQAMDGVVAALQADGVRFETVSFPDD